MGGGGVRVTRGTYAAAQWCAGFSSASPPHSLGSGYAASCSPVSLSPWIHLLGREEPKLVGPTSPGGFWRENKIPCQQIVSTAMKEPRRARHLLPDPKANGRISHLGHLPNDKNLWRTSLRNTSESRPTFSQPPVCPCVSTVCWPGLLVPALMYSQGRSSPASAEEQKVKSERDVTASGTQTSVEKAFLYECSALQTQRSLSGFPSSSRGCNLYSGLLANIMSSLGVLKERRKENI